MTAVAAPVFSHNAASVIGAGNVVDISDVGTALYPPVLILTFTGGPPTVLVQGSHDAITWVDFSGGGFNTSDGWDLIVGIRF